jgi:predicted lipoprotein with Yx(FWY)xxD motif
VEGVNWSIIKEKPEMKRLALVVGTAVVGLSTLTACGTTAHASSTVPQSTPSPSAPATASPSAPATGAASLSTAAVGNFGKIVVDGTGRTLYVYDLDTAKPSMSNCNGSCATAWPPLLAGTGTPKVSGVAASLVGTVTRSDGTKQITLAGSPLYYFANDAKAGDAKGQAVGGIWWVVGANGKKITQASSSSSSSNSSPSNSSSSNSGY